MTSTVTTEQVTTLDLTEGDILRHYGMRLRLGARNISRSHVDRGFGPTVWFMAEVLNPAEVTEVPASWMNHYDRGYPSWVVQGTRLALWAREV